MVHFEAPFEKSPHEKNLFSGFRTRTELRQEVACSDTEWPKLVFFITKSHHRFVNTKRSTHNYLQAKQTHI